MRGFGSVGLKSLRRQSMRCDKPLLGIEPMRCRRTRCEPLRGSQSLRGRFAVTVSTDDLQRAAQEALFCERILAKSGENILHGTLAGTASVEAWTHYPQNDAFDPESGAQWYYHCHLPAADEIEHGHFHCFLRPEGSAGPVHHLVAAGVDAHGRLHRLFTVNQWVVGDNWLDAEKTVALLPRFDMQLARPSYLVNRWLTAIVRLYEMEIAELIRKRDRVLAVHTPPAAIAVRKDRELEVTSTLPVDLIRRARELGI